MLTLATRLAGRGHDVIFAGHIDAQTQVERLGLGFRRLGTDNDKGFQAGATRELSATLGQRRKHAATAYTLRALGAAGRVQVRDLPLITREEHADAIIVDQVTLGGGTAAKIAGVPFASIANALLINTEPAVPPVAFDWPPARGPVARLRNRSLHTMAEWVWRRLAVDVQREHRARGLPQWTVASSLSSALQIAQQPEWFEFPRRELPQNFHFTGPFHDQHRDRAIAFPWSHLERDRPLIYTSMGTLQNNIAGTFRAIAEAVAQCRHAPRPQLVLALGGSPVELGDLPGDPIVARYAPQVELLARADVAIVHGGLNGTLEALRAGVPMVVIPVTNDQPGVAARTRYVGAGTTIGLGSLVGRANPRPSGVMRLRSAIDTLLENRTTREHCRALAARMGVVDGPSAAADLIEKQLL